MMLGMDRLASGSCVLLLLGACGSDPPPSTGGDSSTGMPPAATTSGTSTGDGATTMPVTTMPPGDETFGPGCGPNPCAACMEPCENYDLCIASEWTCDCICPETSTGGPDVCDSIDVALALWLEESINPPMDCGTAGEMDDAAAWQAVHDCVAALAGGGALQASWSTPSLAPAPYEFGAGARFTGMFETVWYEVSGVFTLTEYSCSGLAVTPDCTVDVGQMCLECVDQVEVAVVCTDE